MEYVTKTMNKSEAAKHLDITEEQLMKRFYRGIDKPYKRNGELVWEFIVPSEEKLEAMADMVETIDKKVGGVEDEAEELPDDENEE